MGEIPECAHLDDQEDAVGVRVSVLDSCNMMRNKPNPSLELQGI